MRFRVAHHSPPLPVRMGSRPEATETAATIPPAPGINRGAYRRFAPTRTFQNFGFNLSAFPFRDTLIMRLPSSCCNSW